MATKPALVAANICPRIISGTSIPENRSPWIKSVAPSELGSNKKWCSPAKIHRFSTVPSQRSSRPDIAVRIVGVNVIARLPGGAIVTRNWLPGEAIPLIAVMNGFHDGIAEKSVSTLQTLAGDASIRM